MRVLWLAARFLVALLMLQQTSQGHSKEESELVTLRKQSRENPGDFQVHMHLASLLHQLDHTYPDGGSRLSEAERAYRSAIDIAPNYFAKSVLMGNLGALLLSAGKLPEALIELDHSIQLGRALGAAAQANTAGALFNRGKALSALGEGQEAQQSYRQAYKLAEGVAPSTWTKALAALKLHTGAELAAMEAAAAFLAAQEGSKTMIMQKWHWLQDTALQDQSWLFFALHAAYEAKALYDKAWEHLVKGNELQKASQEDPVPSQDNQLLAGLKAFFPLITQQSVRSSTYEALLGGAGGFVDETPVFVVGMPRSGSTLVEQILASHPDVAGAGEDTALAPLIPQLLSALEGRKSGTIHFAEIAKVGQAYVTRMRSRLRPGPIPSRIIDKMLRNAWNVGYIAFMLPKARIIWTTRHPLDVALSCFAQPFEGRGTPWAWDLNEIANQLELTHQVMTHWENVFPGKILRVSYEELVTNLEATSRQMVSFIGLEWDAAILDFHRTKRDVSTASQSQVRQSLYTSSIGKWKHYESHLRALQEQLQPLISDFESTVSRQRGTKEEL